MKVRFKCPRKIDRDFYGVGIHEVPASLLDHWYFKAILHSKEVEILELTSPHSESVLQPENSDIPEIKEEQPGMSEFDPKAKAKKSKRGSKC